MKTPEIRPTITREKEIAFAPGKANLFRVITAEWEKSIFPTKLLMMPVLMMCLLTMLMTVGFPLKSLSQNWYNNSWAYRKSHTINQTTGAGTNYQVLITVNYGAGTDGSGNVFCNSLCKTDFGDIRFTASDGSTLLSYWIQSNTTGSNAVFWVKVSADLSSAAQTIYVYYGNSGVTTGSDAAGTFNYYDDGSSLPSWTTAGTAGSTTGLGNPQPSYYANGAIGNYLSRNTGLSANTLTTFNVFTQSNNLGNFFFLCNSGGYGQMYRIESRSTFSSGFASTTNWTTWQGPSSSFLATASQWYKFGIAITSSTSATLYYQQTTDATPTFPSTTLGTYTVANRGTYIGLVGDGGGSSFVTYWDNIITRKYVSPEPAHGTWGNQEFGTANWQAQFISMNLGSPAAWCQGETRTVTVTVKNIGLATWTNSSPQIRIGVKWNEWADYHVRTDANGLAPGATQTYSLTVTAPSSGTNNLTFDVVNELVCWFGGNSGGCGPGNTVFISPAVTINAVPVATVTGQTNISCNAGADGKITVQAIGGTSPYYFSIDNGSTWTPSSGPGIAGPFEFTGLNATTIYKPMVKDLNGCMSHSFE